MNDRSGNNCGTPVFSSVYGLKESDGPSQQIDKVHRYYTELYLAEIVRLIAKLPSSKIKTAAAQMWPDKGWELSGDSSHEDVPIISPSWELAEDLLVAVGKLLGEIDSQAVELLVLRDELAEYVGALKTGVGMQIIRKDVRKARIVAAIKMAENNGHSDPAMVGKVFELIIDSSEKMQVNRFPQVEVTLYRPFKLTGEPATGHCYTSRKKAVEASEDGTWTVKPVPATFCQEMGKFYFEAAGQQMELHVIS